ncbi:hypothetical protein HY227_00250 [Candidatus Wolfebacteria bacterium]|nr:hypothetical protein [Candidatus Wolfebacteria bacterium]
MNLTIRYIVIFAVILSLSFGWAIQLNIIRKAEAAWWSTFPQQIADLAKKIYRWLEENWQKILRDIIAKQIIDYLVDETVKWIQGGGDPKFVADWKGFLQDAGNIAFNAVVTEAKLTRFCQPFKAQILLGLTPPRKFSKRLECTIDKVVGNVQNFYNSFQNGGWLAYNEAWQPQNNFFGASIMVNDELLQRIANEKTAAANEAVAGLGFLNSKECVEWQEDNQGSLAPGNMVCVKYKTRTPASTIGKAVGEAITSDKDWAANIESWVATLINAAISRLTREGLSAMQGTGGATYVPPAAAPYIKQEAQTTARRMSELPLQLLGEEQYILDGRTRALNAAKEILDSLKKLKDLQASNPQNQSCLPAVRDEEIQTAQAEFDRLTQETAETQAIVDELQAYLEKLNSAQTTEEIGGLLPMYEEILDKYGNSAFMDQIPDQKEKVNKDAGEKESQLPATRERLQRCESSLPFATSTTP